MTWLDDHIFESKQKGTRCGYLPGCTAIVDKDEGLCIDCTDAYERDREHDTHYDPLRPTPLKDDDSEEEDEKEKAKT